MAHYSPRRTHRKQASALRLSSDTTNTLPEYITVDDTPSDQPPDYPDSAEEADEDTDSSSSDNRAVYVLVPPLSPPVSASTSPRRLGHRRGVSYSHSSRPSNNHTHTHRRKHSSPSSSLNDPYLDSLLARSVHALEMSNTLLQTSISTQSSLSNVFASSDTPAGGMEVLETRAQGLSRRIRDRVEDQQPKWADELEEITKGVEKLFDEERHPVASGSSSAMAIGSRTPTMVVSPSISCSLPSASPPGMLYRQKRRPSMLELQSEASNRPSLHLSYQDRADLVSPPPRALTQYISLEDPDSISIPSTLGLRAGSSSHSASSSYSHPAILSQPAFSSSNLSLHAPLSSPQLTDKPLVPATPAYNMLSAFVNHRPAMPSSSTGTPSLSIPAFGLSNQLPAFLSHTLSRQNSRKSNPSPSTERTSFTPTQSPPTTTRTTSPTAGLNAAKSKSRSPDTIRSKLPRERSKSRSPRSLTPKQIYTSLPSHRPMTPPAEESTPSSSSSTESSDDCCTAKLTVQSLRKILDEQPAPPPPAPTQSDRLLKPPAFHPRTPAVAPAAGTSTATASISRLFTKGKHTSSTRPPSPPRQSAMKQSSMPGTPSLSQGGTPASTAPHTPDAMSPSPSPTALHLSIPELLGIRRAESMGSMSGSSAPSSGRSTPAGRAKRISFAALPESYAGSKGGSSRFRDKKGRRKDSGLSGGKGKGKKDGEGVVGGWWGWLGAGSGHLSNGGREERMEDRLSRSWGGRMTGTGFGNGLDEWAV